MAVAAVFQIGSLGDSVVSVPALLSIRELLPDCTDYAVVTGFQNTAKLISSSIFDLAWPSSARLDFRQSGPATQRYWSATAVLAKLRWLRPKYGVYLMPSERTPQQVARDTAFFRLGGVRHLVGFRALAESERQAASPFSVTGREAYFRFRRLWNENAEAKFAHYGRPPFLSADANSLSHVQNWLRGKRRFSARPLVALCPFSNCRSRDLPHSAAQTILNQLEERLQTEVVVAGGGKDRGAATNLIARAGAGLNACGLFDVGQSAALLTLCSLAVCTESGPMHLAGALGVPAVSVFSRVNRSLSQWIALNRTQTVLYQDVPCAGCDLVDCAVPGHPCMTATRAEDVLAAAAAHLNGTAFAGLRSGTCVFTGASSEAVPA